MLGNLTLGDNHLQACVMVAMGTGPYNHQGSHCESVVRALKESDRVRPVSLVASRGFDDTQKSLGERKGVELCSMQYLVH